LSAASGAAEENIVHIIGWIVFGLVVGLVAKFLMPGRDPGGFVITAILGIVGALVGGFVGRLIGLYGEGDPVGFIMAVVGSIILLAIYRFAFVRLHRPNAQAAHSPSSGKRGVGLSRMVMRRRSEL
jgi:uncharacterized membrane protein YeaQ/YmgE (transglycosylase-associated protein family)